MPDVGKDRYVKIARRRLANLQAAQANKATTSARQRGANVTDIDSRLMMTRQGYIQRYNPQAGVNEQGVVAEVAQDANDLRQLVPMLSSLRANRHRWRRRTGRHSTVRCRVLERAQRHS